MAEATTSAASEQRAGSRDASQVVLEAVQLSIESTSLKLPSSEARAALNLAKEFCSNFFTNSKIIEVCNSIVDSLAGCIPGEKGRLRWKEKMWREYHTTRTATKFILSWQELFVAIMGTKEGIELLCQHVTDIIFDNLLTSSLACEPSRQPVTACISSDEENALRYISGYVISKLKQKLKKSNHALKKDLLIGLTDFVDESCEGASSSWTSLVDRGGLCKLTEDAYTFFL